MYHWRRQVRCTKVSWFSVPQDLVYRDSLLLNCSAYPEHLHMCRILPTPRREALPLHAMLTTWFDGDPLKVSWRKHVFIRTSVHQYLHKKPVFGLALCAGLLPRCIQFHTLHLHPHPCGRDDPNCWCPGWFSRFEWLRFPLVESSLTPSESSLRSRCSFRRLCLSCLCLLGPLPLFVLQPAIFGHVTNTSAHEATCPLSSGFTQFPHALVAFALSRQGMDLHVAWPSFCC